LDAAHAVIEGWPVIDLVLLLIAPILAVAMWGLCYLPPKVFVSVFLLVAGTLILIGVSL
jgi:hypothetical protein